MPRRVPPGALTATGIGKRFGSLSAAEDVTLTIEPGELTALVGPNGSGKTTVLRLLAGTFPPDAGRVERPRGGVARTLQSTAVFPTLTPVAHLLIAGASRRCRSGFARSLLSTPQARAEDAAFVADARRILTEFGLPTNDGPAGELPVSEQRLLMLAAAYATGAGTLLVDEPTAGSSAAEATRVIEQLRRLRDEGLGLLVVEHNLAVVRSLADRVVVLDAGRVLADGTPDEVAADAGVRAAYLGRQRL